MGRRVLDMSVGDIAANVWSVSGRSRVVDWDDQQTRPEHHQTRHHDPHVPGVGVGGGRSRVSRSLFGPSDPQENRRMAFEETDCKRYSDRNRWNFDFYSEKPFTGRFEWKKVCHQLSDGSKRSFSETGEHRAEDSMKWSQKKSAKS